MRQPCRSGSESTLCCPRLGLSFTPCGTKPSSGCTTRYFCVRQAYDHSNRPINGQSYDRRIVECTVSRRSDEGRDPILILKRKKRSFHAVGSRLIPVFLGSQRSGGEEVLKSSGNVDDQDQMSTWLSSVVYTTLVLAWVGLLSWHFQSTVLPRVRERFRKETAAVHR